MSDEVLRRAELLIDAGQYDVAAGQLRQYLATDPDDPEARRLLGRAQLNLGDLIGARDSVSAVLAARPDDVNAYLLAAAVHSACDDRIEARRAADEAIRLAPDQPAPYRVSAAIDIDAGRVNEDTFRHARRAVELDPENALGQRLAGSALLDLKRRTEAGEFLKRSSALDPTNPGTTAELARWNSLRGRQSAAALDFAHVVRSDPTNTAALRNLEAVVWRTFGLAQLVLWVTTVVLSRIRLFSTGDPASWAHAVGPVAVVLALIAWALQLRGSWRGIRPMLTVVRTDRSLLIGLTAHCLCLLAFLLTLLPGGYGEAALIVGVVLLAIASICTWRRGRQDRPADDQPAHFG